MRPCTARRRAAVLLGAIAVGATLAAALAPAAGAATRPACRVKNPTRDAWFATRDGQALTRAIAAADPGDRLNVFGTCRGNYVIGKDLRVFGNTAADPGGGILSVNTLTLNHTVVSGNVPDDCAC